MISVTKPNIGKEEIKAVGLVLKSGMLSQGKLVKEFEDRFAVFNNVRQAVATSSGTAALHLTMLALGIGPGDEVITTPFTFIASANAILYTGAKPIFVDVDEKTFNLDPKLIEKKITSKTKAILPVHLYGFPADMEGIMAVARRHRLAVIEDVCQAHGAKIKGKKVGSIGIAGCFSFYPTKNMTTGEGGMVTTNNGSLADKLRLLRNHGMKIRYHHEIVGYNFRLTDIGAAIGIEQLKKLNKFNEARIRNALFLNSELSKIPGIITPVIPRGSKPVFHQYTIRVMKQYGKSRDEVSDYLQKNGIGTAIYYPVPIHKQKAYLDLGYKYSLPVAEKLSREVLSLPVYPGIKIKVLQYLVNLLKAFV